MDIGAGDTNFEKHFTIPSLNASRKTTSWVVRNKQCHGSKTERYETGECMVIHNHGEKPKSQVFLRFCGRTCVVNTLKNNLENGLHRRRQHL